MYHTRVTFVLKKDNCCRAVVDFWLLTDTTVPDPLPVLQVLLQSTGKNNIFYSVYLFIVFFRLDLKSDFWRIPLDKESKIFFTSLSFPLLRDTTYEWLRCLMAFANHH